MQLFILNEGIMTTELVESYVKPYNQALKNVQLLKEELYSFFNPILKPVNIETEHLAFHLTYVKIFKTSACILVLMSLLSNSNPKFLEFRIGFNSRLLKNTNFAKV